MSIQLNKHAYEDLIIGDIVEILKYMPEHSLEKKHIIKVLKWSVKQIYPDNIWNKATTCTNCDGEGYTYFVNQGEPDPDSWCVICKGTGKMPPKTEEMQELYFNERILKKMNEKKSNDLDDEIEKWEDGGCSTGVGSDY